MTPVLMLDKGERSFHLKMIQKSWIDTWLTQFCIGKNWGNQCEIVVDS